jgi:hypothetical protein
LPVPFRQVQGIKIIKCATCLNCLLAALAFSISFFVCLSFTCCKSKITRHTRKEEHHSLISQPFLFSTTHPWQKLNSGRTLPDTLANTTTASEPLAPHPRSGRAPNSLVDDHCTHSMASAIALAPTYSWSLLNPCSVLLEIYPAARPSPKNKTGSLAFRALSFACCV